MLIPDVRIGFVGGGNMAEAIIRGMLGRGWGRDRLSVTVRSPERGARWSGLGVRTVCGNRELAGGSDVVVLCVKPQVFAETVGAELSGLVDGKLVVSVMAGVGTARIGEALGGGCRVVRTMPNVALSVGAGVTGVVAGAGANEADVELVRKVFSCAGEVVDLPDEGLMHAFTAVCGSGPAYLFYLAEAMAEAGGSAGLKGLEVDRMVRATLLGASRLLEAEGDAVGAAGLRARVTSRGGVTAAAMAVMEEGGLRGLVGEAIRSGAARSEALGG